MGNVLKKIIGSLANSADALMPAFTLDALGAASSYALTNTRALKQTITDHEGIYHQAQDNELPWNGLRRNENLLRRSSTGAGSQVSGGAVPTGWVVAAGGATVAAPTFGTFSDGVEYAEYVITNTSGSTKVPQIKFVYATSDITSVAGEKIAFRIRMSIPATSAGTVPSFVIAQYSTTPTYLAAVSQVISAANTVLADAIYATGTPLTVSNASTAYIVPYINASVPDGGSITIRIANVHVQKVRGASNLVCGEYVDAATTYNAGIAGVRYLPTTNGNSVNGSLVMTEAVGAAISNTWTGLSLPQTQINYKTYSEDMDAVDWTLTNATAPDDGTLGPDGIGQLQKFTDDATNGVHTLYGAASGATTGTMHTKCFHVKAGTLYGVVLRVGSDANYGQAEFRFSDMTVVTTASLGTGTFRNAWIERVGLTDIYRIIVCATFSGAILSQAKVLAAQSAGVTSYVGTSQYCYIGFSDLFVGHDSPGPYIPNKATGTTTRALNAPSGKLPGVFAANGNMTMVVKFKPFYNTAATWKQDWYDGVFIGSAAAFVKSHHGTKTAAVWLANKYTGSANTAAVTATQFRLQQVGICTGVRGGALNISVDGGAVSANANTTIQNNIAAWYIDDIHGLVQRIEFWPRAMGDAEMRARSTP